MRCFGNSIVIVLVAVATYVIIAWDKKDTKHIFPTLSPNDGILSNERSWQQPQIEGDLNTSKKQNHIRNSMHIAAKHFNAYTNTKLFFKTRKVVETANCRSIFNGDETEIKRAKTVFKRIPKRGITPQQYIKMTKNCGQFIEDRGYITDSLTEDEKNFPISFSILMYDYVELAERLLRAIYRPQNIYCIHVDAKAKPEMYQAVSSIVNCFENVFISKRIEVTWGTYSVLESELICAQELWNKSKHWKYFINLTGQEFPLKTNYEIVQILKAYNGSNSVVAKIKRFDKLTRRLKDAGEPPLGIVPMKGPVHIVVSRKYVDFILHDQRARDILNWARSSKVPDELFFSSVHGNRFLQVPGSSKVGQAQNITFVARYKNWSGPCDGKRVRRVCIFGVGDLPVLASRYELFANKFHLNYHPIVLDCVEELHFNRTRDQYLGKVEFDARRYVDGGFLVYNQSDNTIDQEYVLERTN